MKYVFDPKCMRKKRWKEKQKIPGLINYALPSTRVCLTKSQTAAPGIEEEQEIRRRRSKKK